MKTKIFSTIIIILILLSQSLCATRRPIKLKTDPKSNVTAVFLTCCERHFMLYQVIQHFATYNQYPIRNHIIVLDGQITNSFVKSVKLFYPIILIVTGKKVGQVAAIDQAFRSIDTPYVFFSEDDFIQTRSGAISQDIKILQSEPDVLQVWNHRHIVNGVNLVKEDGYADLNHDWSGFSFNPTVHRMDWYKKLPNGYSGITYNFNYGKGAGMAQKILIDYYKTFSKVKGLPLVYFEHIGGKYSLNGN